VLEGAFGDAGVDNNTSIGPDIVGPTIFGHNGASTSIDRGDPVQRQHEIGEFLVARPVTLFFGEHAIDDPTRRAMVLAKPDFARLTVCATTSLPS